MSRAPRILVVDDDDDIREVISLLLRAEGYQADGARDGLDALELMHADGSPDLILLDLRMPRMSGPDLACALRADPARAHIPIVILSGDANAPQCAARLGIAECLQKPVDLGTLLETLERTLSKRAYHHPIDT